MVLVAATVTLHHRLSTDGTIISSIDPRTITTLSICEDSDMQKLALHYSGATTVKP